MPVEIDGTVHQVYVLKRPHVDEFLQRMGELYECVLFTASLAKVLLLLLASLAFFLHVLMNVKLKLQDINNFLFVYFQYADPVADLLDRWGVFRVRLFRESCVFHRGNYVKDLNKLGRDLQKVIIVDNSPASYIFHPDNAVSIFLCMMLFSVIQNFQILFFTVCIFLNRFLLRHGLMICKILN